MGARGLMRDGSIEFRPTLVDDGIERSESASPPLASRDEKRIQFIRASDLDQLGDARWAIDKALPFEGIVEWIAAKGSLKTYTALDTQIRATVGIHWFDAEPSPLAAPTSTPRGHSARRLVSTPRARSGAGNRPAHQSARARAVRLRRVFRSTTSARSANWSAP